jgi:hypothetical protein
MRKLTLCLTAVAVLNLLVPEIRAQEPLAKPVVPRLVQFSGTIKETTAIPVEGVTFALYKDQEGGAAIWLETQNVQMDENGHYSALLGATKNEGLPMDLFSSGEARWLGVQPAGQPEQPRVLLLSVPYALKAGDAETLGGLRPSAFLLAASTNSGAITESVRTVDLPALVAAASIGGGGTTDFVPIWTSSTALGNSVLFQSGGKVGLGTSTPGSPFDVRSTGNAMQALTSSSTGIGVLGTAIGTTGATFGVQGLSASGSGVGVLGKNTATTGSTIGVMAQVSSATGTAAVVNNQGGGDVFVGEVAGATKFVMDKNGDLTVSDGDVNILTGDVALFSGNVVFQDLTKQSTAAITQVTAGPGLSGGGKAPAVTLMLDTTFTDARYLRLAGGTLSGPLTGTTATLSTTTGDSVVGSSTSGNAIVGTSTSGGIGVEGSSTGFRGVVGNSDTHGGVVGFSNSNDGTVGVACNSACGGAGIVGMGQRAGLFQGNVGVSGTLAVSGLKQFHIDHPLDPANKFLNHAAVESNEVLNVYSGNITTDADGTATVELANYFSALNDNFRYQLTVVGQFAQAIVFKEIQNNAFVIKTDKPDTKVSWQVTARRHDAWAKNHPMQVEEDKSEKERGYYLHPELFGQPEERSISWLYRPATMRDAKALWSREKVGLK